MVERLRRLREVDGLPAVVKFDNPNAFFEDLERNSRDIAQWKGELYFELHRGTYTTQAETKKFNRMAEFLLRDVELVWALIGVHGGHAGEDAAARRQRHHEIERLWKL
ncbi:hypothetical protein HK405_012114, partial [Cladochytrium tenue]